MVVALPRYLVVYDADCGMCTRFRNTVEFLDTHRNLSFISIDYAERIGLLDSLPDLLRHRSFHLILPCNRIESGAEALPTLIRQLPAGGFGLKIIESVPLGRALVGLLYSTVSRRHEAGSCKIQNSSYQISVDLDNLKKETKARLVELNPVSRSGFSAY